MDNIATSVREYSPVFPCNVCRQEHKTIPELYHHLKSTHTLHELSLAVIFLSGWKLPVNEGVGFNEGNGMLVVASELGAERSTRNMIVKSLSSVFKGEPITYSPLEKTEPALEENSITSSKHSISKINVCENSPLPDNLNGNCRTKSRNNLKPNFNLVQNNVCEAKFVDGISGSDTETDIEVNGNDQFLDSDYDLKIDIFDEYEDFELDGITAGCDNVSNIERTEGENNSHHDRNYYYTTGTVHSSCEKLKVSPCDKVPSKALGNVPHMSVMPSSNNILEVSSSTTLGISRVNVRAFSRPTKPAPLHPNHYVQGVFHNNVNNNNNNAPGFAGHLIDTAFSSLINTELVNRHTESNVSSLDVLGGILPENVEDENRDIKSDSMGDPEAGLEKQNRVISQIVGGDTLRSAQKDVNNNKWQNLKSKLESNAITKHEVLGKTSSKLSGLSVICTGGFFKAKAEPGPVKGSAVLKVTERRFFCESCGKGYKKKSHLERHLRAHTGERPFQCSYCIKRFAVRSILKQHVRIHTGEKPYCCSVCSQRFPQKSGLMTHMMLHTGKPFKCDLCDKSFVSNHKLLQHLKSHESLHIYSCKICDTKCFTEGALREHSKIHTGTHLQCHLENNVGDHGNLY